MTVDDASGTVTICEGQGLFLRADAAGLLLRRFPFGHARRIGWSEISHFADGSSTKEGATSWVLVIVLRTGKRVPVLCSVLAPVGEVVAAVQEAARPYGVPANLAGAPTMKGRPAKPGFYEDPGGRAGLRYWNGKLWSPLLPPDVTRPAAVHKSRDTWATLPTAERGWTYAARRARTATVMFATFATVTAVLLAGGLVTELWWDHGTQHRHTSGAGWFGFGGGAALLAFGEWRTRGRFLKLDEAAKATPGSWS